MEPPTAKFIGSEPITTWNSGAAPPLVLSDVIMSPASGVVSGPGVGVGVLPWHCGRIGASGPSHGSCAEAGAGCAARAIKAANIPTTASDIAMASSRMCFLLPCFISLISFEIVRVDCWRPRQTIPIADAAAAAVKKVDFSNKHC